MSQLFASNGFAYQDTFTAPELLSGGAYPLLINGRPYNGRIVPTKKHRRISIPPGKIQGLYTFGPYVLLFVSGFAWYADARSDNFTWKKIENWVQMSHTAERLYAILLPQYSNNFSISYSDNNVEEARYTALPNVPSPFLQQVLVTDGVSNPQVIYPDGTARLVNSSTASWDMYNPEYVPKSLILPVRYGDKLYGVDANTRTRIYHSVSGRFLDFVVNRKGDGTFGGDENTTFKSVDFNPIVSLKQAQGGVIVATNAACYIIFPDFDNRVFGEPMLRDEMLIPYGAVAEDAILNVDSDIIIVTNSGLSSINTMRALRTESNYNPFGRPLHGIIKTPQENVVCTQHGTDYLFSITTTLGQVVAIYDSLSRNFVSIDANFGTVKFFAPMLLEGKNRLFYTTADELFEAYASEEYAVTHFHVGRTFSPHHKVTTIQLCFAHNKPFDVSASLVTNGSETTFTETRSGSSRIVVTVGNRRLAVSTDYWLSWNNGAQLQYVFADGEVDTSTSSLTIDNPRRVDDNVRLTFFADSDITLVESSSTPKVFRPQDGRYYYVDGYIGDQPGRVIYGNVEYVYTGSVYDITDFWLVITGMQKYRPNLYVGAGDHVYPGGEQVNAARIKAILDCARMNDLVWVPGNHDVMTQNGRYFYEMYNTIEYDYRDVGFIRLFLLNTTLPFGPQVGYLKANIRSDAFNILVMHHTPYTVDDIHNPGRQDLRLPFRQIGINLLITGHAHLYQRFMSYDVPIIVLGPAGSPVRNPVSGSVYADVVDKSQGFLVLSATRFALTAQWLTTQHEKRDELIVRL